MRPTVEVRFCKSARMASIWLAKSSASRPPALRLAAPARISLSLDDMGLSFPGEAVGVARHATLPWRASFHFGLRGTLRRRNLTDFGQKLSSGVSAPGAAMD